MLAGGRVLAEKIGGVPPKVVALHGWARSGRDFVDLLDGLDAVALHLPGFGIAETPADAWGTPEYADHVIAALEETGPVVLIGHSFGGRVAVRIAARRPDLVRGLVLTGVPLVRVTPARRPALGYRIVRWLARRGLVSQVRLDRQREKHGSTDYRAASGVMRDVLVRVINEDYRDDLARVAAPTRFVWGALDDQAPVEAGRAAAGLVTGAAFREEAGGHLLEGAVAHAVRDELDALLTELDGAASRGTLG